MCHALFTSFDFCFLRVFAARTYGIMTSAFFLFTIIKLCAYDATENHRKKKDRSLSCDPFYSFLCSEHLLIFSFETGDRIFYDRYQHNQNREHAFQSDVGDIVKKRPCPCVVACGCICREKKSTGEKTDKKPAKDGDKIAHDHTVFPVSEKSADFDFFTSKTRA